MDIKADINSAKLGNSVIHKIRYRFMYLLKNYSIVIILICLIIFVSCFSDVFLTKNNIINILRQVSVVGILACGMTFVIISGGIDLSVGSILSLTGCMVITLIPKIGILPAILIALLVGLAIGLINGLIISRIGGRMGDSFIITFGMQTLIAAAAFIYTKGYNISGSDTGAYSFIGQGFIGVIPVPVLIFIITIIVCELILKNTIFGRMVYSIGCNEEATWLTGINTKFFRFIVYGIAGVTAAMGAVVLNSRVMGASPRAGVGYELDVIASVVVGGTSLNGGSGSLMRTLMGVVIMGVLTNALNILNVTTYPQMIVKGLIIILAVWLDTRRK